MVLSQSYHCPYEVGLQMINHISRSTLIHQTKSSVFSQAQNALSNSLRGVLSILVKAIDYSTSWMESL